MCSKNILFAFGLWFGLPQNLGFCFSGRHTARRRTHMSHAPSPRVTWTRDGGRRRYYCFGSPARLPLGHTGACRSTSSPAAGAGGTRTPGGPAATTPPLGTPLEPPLPRRGIARRTGRAAAGPGAAAAVVAAAVVAAVAVAGIGCHSPATHIT